MWIKILNLRKQSEENHPAADFGGTFHVDCRASAQTAQEVTKDCTLSSVGKKTLNNMTDGRYTSYWSSSTNRNAYLDIEAPQGQKMGSVYIQVF